MLYYCKAQKTERKAETLTTTMTLSGTRHKAEATAPIRTTGAPTISPLMIQRTMTTTMTMEMVLVQWHWMKVQHSLIALKITNFYQFTRGVLQYHL